MNYQPKEDIESTPKLTRGFNLKVRLESGHISLRIGSLLMETDGNKYSQ